MADRVVDDEGAGYAARLRRRAMAATQAAEALRQAGRGFVSPKSPPDETYGHEQEQHDQGDCEGWRSQREERDQGGAA